MILIGIKLADASISQEVLNKIKEYNKDWDLNSIDQFILECDYDFFSDPNETVLKKIIELYRYLIAQNVNCELYKKHYVYNSEYWRTDLVFLEEIIKFEEPKSNVLAAISQKLSPEQIKKELNALADFISQYVSQSADIYSMDSIKIILQGGIDKVKKALRDELLEELITFEQLKSNALAAICERLSPERNKKIEEAMNSLYDFVSKYEVMDSFQQFVLQKGIEEVERALSHEFLELDSEPEYDWRNVIEFPKSLDTEGDIEQAVSSIVWNTRNFLSYCYIKDTKDRKDLRENWFKKNDALSNECIKACDYIQKICKEHGVNSIRFAVNENLQQGNFHHFIIIRISNKFYLVDCTYRQFFTKSRMFLKRLSAVRTRRKGSFIGTYMIMTEERKKIAEQLLKYGYIEATSTNLKTYLDAIIFSGRDGNFYKEHGLDYTNPEDCIPRYSLKEYFDILKKNYVIPSSEKTSNFEDKLFE